MSQAREKLSRRVADVPHPALHIPHLRAQEVSQAREELSRAMADAPHTHTCVHRSCPRRARSCRAAWQMRRARPMQCSTALLVQWACWMQRQLPHVAQWRNCGRHRWGDIAG